MTSWSSRAELEHHIVLWIGRGRSQRQMARAFGVSRGLVQRLLRAHAKTVGEPHSALPEPRPIVPRGSKLDAYQERIGELLALYPAITAQRIFEELHAAGYDGGYSILKARVGRLRPPKAPEPSLVRPVFGPGEMAEQDWSSYRVDFADGPHRVHGFMLPLSYSRHRHADFFESEDLFALLEAHRRAFESFEGVPARIRYDNQKAVVARREGPDVIYQPRLLAFATHYGFEPVAVRPGRPNDKAFVERDLWDLERSFLCGRRFRDLADMRAQVERWLREVVDVRRHPKMRDRRIVEVFEAQEKPALRPLPRHPFDTARVVYRLCSIEGFVHWEGNRYSVPYEHVTALLPVRITQRELFAYGPSLECVAQHELLPKGQGADSVIPSHRPPRPDGAGASLELVRPRFVALDEAAGEFLAGLVQALPRSAAYHARRILELRERYAAPDVGAAISHALCFQAFSYTAVTRIVEVRARPRTLDEYVAAETENRLRGLLSDERLTPRDLGTYDTPALPAPDTCSASEPPPPCPTDPNPTTPPSKPE